MSFATFRAASTFVASSARRGPSPKTKIGAPEKPSHAINAASVFLRWAGRLKMNRAIGTLVDKCYGSQLAKRLRTRAFGRVLWATQGIAPKVLNTLELRDCQSGGPSLCMRFE